MINVISIILCFCIYNSYQEKPPTNDGTVIGIDLGTTYSCVGIFKNGRVEIIANEQGNRITPSYVSFTADGFRLVGDAAKNQLPLNPTHTIYDMKRFLGRDWQDDVLQKDLAQLTFKMVERKGRPSVETSNYGGIKHFAPEEISAMVLAKMREIAQSYLGHEVLRAVITVPAYFNDAQRQATKDAGAIAGLDVVRILNEPTAAAIAYGLDKKSLDQNILVFDLGGGTFDVSLLSVAKGVFEVLATNGDTHLGGEDFDMRVINYFIEEFRKKYAVNIRKNSRAFQRLRNAVEKAKITLSASSQTRIEIDNLLHGMDFSEVLTRAKFEELNMDLFKSTLMLVSKVLEDAKISTSDVNEIVLVGGSTRIPKVQELVKDMFGGKEPSRGINPDEAVAYGAAIQAGVIGGEEETSDLVLLDVNPLTLGIDIDEGIMSPIVPRNTLIPTKKSNMYTTVVDNQDTIKIQIYEGESKFTKDNHLLGTFDVTNIPPAPAKIPQIEVTFTIDTNGIIQVTAEDKQGGTINQVTIKSDRKKLSEEEIENMVKKSEQYEEQEKIQLQADRGRNDLEAYLYQVTNQLKDERLAALPQDTRSKIEGLVDYLLNWSKTHPHETTEEYMRQRQQAIDLIDPYISQYIYDDDHDEL